MDALVSVRDASATEITLAFLVVVAAAAAIMAPFQSSAVFAILRNQKQPKVQKNKTYRPSIALPDDVISHIVTYLSFNQLVKCSGVSTSWRNAISKMNHIRIGLDHNNPEQMRFATSGIFSNLASVHIHIHFDADADADADDESNDVIIGDRILSDRIDYFFEKCSSTIRRVYLDGRLWRTHTCEALQSLKFAPHLEELRMYYCRFHSVKELVSIVQGAEDLKVLEWRKCNFSAYCLRPDGFDCRVLSECMQRTGVHNLTEVVLDNWNLNDFNLRNICRVWKDLRKLVVANANDEALERIALHCTNLEELEITRHASTKYDQSTMRGISALLKKCPRLHTLTIPNMRGNGSGIKNIRQICALSSSIKNLEIGLQFWDRTVEPSIPWSKKKKLMEEAAVEASCGRLNVVVQDGI